MKAQYSNRLGNRFSRPLINHFGAKRALLEDVNTKIFSGPFLKITVANHMFGRGNFKREKWEHRHLLSKTNKNSSAAPMLPT